MDLGLKGKVALVLAASKGLGRACAVELAKEGASVVIGSRNEERLKQTALEIEQESGSRVVPVPTDVTKGEDIQRIVQRTVSEFGTVHILVNNAGGPPPGTFENFSDAEWLSAFELTFLSTVRIIREVVPYMRKEQSGRIINIVSTSVKQPIDGLLLSNAIRPGVIGLAKSLSLELAADNITVNNVCPGPMVTDRILKGKNFQQMRAQGMSEEEALHTLGQNMPMKRLGRPEELAALVVFLASERASYISGTTIQVDGGLTKSLM